MIHDFEEDFVCHASEDGTITFGDVIVRTGDDADEDEDHGEHDWDDNEDDC